MEKLRISLPLNSVLLLLFLILQNASAPPKDSAGSSSKKIYWAVVKGGRERGIYNTWQECLGNIRGYPDAYMRTFDNLANARKFVENPHNLEISLEGSSQSGQPAYFYNHARDGAGRVVARPTETEIFEFPDDVRAVYTDGSTEKDQTSIGVFWGDGDQRNIGELVKDAKKDSGELHAIIRAMKDGQNLNGLAIMTDYRNGIMVIKDHLENLRDGENEWRNAQGKRIAPAHIELYREIKVLRQNFLDRGFPVYFVKVDAHSGDYGNNQADRLARKARNAISYYVVPYYGIYTSNEHAKGTGGSGKKSCKNLTNAIDHYLKTSTSN